MGYGVEKEKGYRGMGVLGYGETKKRRTPFTPYPFSYTPSPIPYTPKKEVARITTGYFTYEKIFPFERKFYSPLFTISLLHYFLYPAGCAALSSV